MFLGDCPPSDGLIVRSLVFISDAAPRSPLSVPRNQTTFSQSMDYDV